MNLQASAQSLLLPAKSTTSAATAGLEQHSLPITLALHLAPGAIFTLIYALLAQPAQRLGLNNFADLQLAGVAGAGADGAGYLIGSWGKAQRAFYPGRGGALPRAHAAVAVTGSGAADAGLAGVVLHAAAGSA